MSDMTEISSFKMLFTHLVDLNEEELINKPATSINGLYVDKTLRLKNISIGFGFI